MSDFFCRRGVVIPSGFGLAPMAGVADGAFRGLCREAGAVYSVSEMVSAKALCYNDKKTAALLLPDRRESPFAVQIFGSSPEIMAEGAKRALEISRADIIDINMGCPAPKIVNNGEGSALLRDRAQIYRIVAAVRAVLTIPLSVKLRLGWDSDDSDELLGVIAGAGADFVCLHGRTKVQMYSGRADREALARAVARSEIPVAVNGDVCSPDDFRILAQTGASLGMLGRGALGRPWIFGMLNSALSGGEIPPEPDTAGRFDYFKRQAEQAIGEKGPRAAAELRRHFAWYCRGLPNGAVLRDLGMKAENLGDYLRLIDRAVGGVV